MKMYEAESSIQGHPIFQESQNSTVREEFNSLQERINSKDAYIVAVMCMRMGGRIASHFITDQNSVW